MIFKGQNGPRRRRNKKSAKLTSKKTSPTRLSTDELADKFAISRRSFERRFKKATNNTVNEYVQRVKIEAAKKIFETTRQNITETMFDVGYSDTKTFRGIFKKITGMTPIDYRNKYNKEA